MKPIIEIRRYAPGWFGIQSLDGGETWIGTYEGAHTRQWWREHYRGAAVLRETSSS